MIIFRDVCLLLSPLMLENNTDIQESELVIALGLLGLLFRTDGVSLFPLSLLWQSELEGPGEPRHLGWFACFLEVDWSCHG